MEIFQQRFNEFFIILYFPVSKKVPNNRNKCSPCIFLYISHGMSEGLVFNQRHNLKTLENTCFEFLNRLIREHFTQILKTVNVSIDRLDKLFHKSQLDVKGRENNFFMFHLGFMNYVLFPTLRLSLTGHSFWIQCLSLAQLSQRQIKQGNFVYPLCCPSKKLTIFRSTQMIHLCSSYLSSSKTVLMCSYFPFRCTECPMGIAPKMLPICNKIHFKLRLELSPLFRIITWSSQRGH